MRDVRPRLMLKITKDLYCEVHNGQVTGMSLQWTVKASISTSFSKGYVVLTYHVREIAMK